MKKFVFLLLFISAQFFAQTNSFLVNKGKLLWENVYISDEANIPEIISRHPRLQIISSVGNIYKGKGTEIKHTCLGTSAELNNKFSFEFEIGLSNGKYRVTIYNLKFEKSHKDKTMVNAENYLTKKGNIKNTRNINNDLACLDNYFNKIFTMTMVYKNKS